MTEIAVRVEGLGKMYRIGAEARRPDSLWDAAKQAALSPFDYMRRITRAPTEDETLWALKDVSFEVKRGEVLGVIGRNGAGKSTLLNILSRITEPTEGSAEINGRVGSLLEVGTGFHPELTGRENVYLNGAILGMRKDEIDRKFDQIVVFSGIDKFIDTPVKRYSSGMRVRLAFSVAAHLDPEILLIDEVLAVGDAAFQKKCLGKMGHVAREGRTVLFVSHNLSAVNSLCDRALLLAEGDLVLDEAPGVVIDDYLAQTGVGESSTGQLDYPDWDRNTGADFVLQHVRTLDQAGRVRASFRSSESVIVEFEFSTRERIPFLKVGFELKTAAEEVVFQSFHNDAHEILSDEWRPGSPLRLRARIPGGLLNGGVYYVEPCASVHRQCWLLRGEGRIAITVAYDVPNPDYVISRRPGHVAPILEWTAFV